MSASLPILDSDQLSDAVFDELDAILDELRSRYDETPSWEFCEGFMAALVCAPQVVSVDDWLEVLLGIAPAEAIDSDSGSFASSAQRARFLALWHARWVQVEAGLQSGVTSLEDERGYHPQVMDIRAAVAAMAPQDQAEFQHEELPAFAQVWALGFMFAVESWPDAWQAPPDAEAAQWFNDALQAIVAITEDDTEPAQLSPLDENGMASTSLARLNAFGEAVWSVYELRELWQTLAPLKTKR